MPRLRIKKTIWTSGIRMANNHYISTNGFYDFSGAAAWYRLNIDISNPPSGPKFTEPWIIYNLLNRSVEMWKSLTT